MTQLLNYAIPGVPFGCVFALMGVGLVLTYKSAGVFNLAFGAQAYVSALAFVSFTVDGWPVWAAALVSVLVIAPALGLVLDRVVFRRVRTASALVKLVPSLGLLVALPQVALMIAGSEPNRTPPSLFLQSQHVYFHLLDVPVSGLELSITVVTLLVALGLTALFSWTSAGLEMRAVVESPRLVELFGINASRQSALSWGLSSAVAGLAGVMLAPLYSQLDPHNFDVLLVWGIAAASIGRFESMQLALVGGLALGVVQEVLAGELPPGVISSGLRPSLPFVVLLLFLPLASSRRLTDPLSACDPPPAAMTDDARGYRSGGILHIEAAATAPSEARPGRRSSGGLRRERPITLGGWLLIALGVISLFTWVRQDWLVTVAQGLAFGAVFLSLTLLTGMSGQISMCQAAFAGIGGFTTGQLATQHGWPILVAGVAGAAAAALVGAVVALPTLRLAGLPLALATLAFALLADNVLFPISWIGNGAAGVRVPRPKVGPVDMNALKPYLVIVIVTVAVMGGIVKRVGEGTTGRFFRALRGSETASSAVGMNVRRLRILVFTVAAGMAGLGGSLYASMQGSMVPDDVNYQVSLVVLVVAAIVGLGSVSAAVIGGVVYVVLQNASATLPARYSGLVAVVFGLAALTYTRHPEGVVDFVGSRMREVAGVVGRSRRAPVAEVHR